ncbi:MAG: hypothetical protein WCC53_12555 [Thermoanaerobaculia bacterium]|jgi:hypothetical protein
MRTGNPVLLALVLGGVAAAQERAPSGRKHEERQHTPPAAQLRLPPPDTFRLFPQLAEDPRLDLSELPEERRPFHQQGDPDSLFTLGKPSPQGELHLLAALEVNEIFLKAIPPDPLVSSSDTRPRAAGSFLPFDSQRRPYQLRLGARLVW